MMTKTEIEHGAGPFPHEGGCAGCRDLQQCNACGTATHGPFRQRGGRTSSDRCTNGRCMTCHNKFCTEGGATSPGHGYWRKGTRPDNRAKCPGSGREAGGFAGDQDTCPVCNAWVTIKRDGNFRAHRGR